MRLLLGGLVWLLAVVAAGMAVLRLSTLESGWAVWLTALTPYALAPALVAVVVGLLAKQRVAAAVAAVSALVLAWTQAPLVVPDGRVAPDALAPDRSLTVLTANLEAGQADPWRVLDSVRSTGAQVVGLQEVSADQLDALDRAGLGRLLPYRVSPRGGAPGTVLLSRLPLTAGRVVTGLSSPVVQARLTAPGLGPLTVVVAHPDSPGRWSTQTWQRDQAGLRALLNGLPGTVLLVGDLNASVDHAPVRRLESDGFVDAADSAGAWVTRTWPQELRLLGGLPVPGPLAALDHVMVRSAGRSGDAASQQLVARDVRVLPPTGSDHRPLAATLASRS